MRRSFARAIPFLLYGISGVFFGCDSSEAPPAGVNAFDRTNEVQADLSTQAQNAMDLMNRQQQGEQTVEALNNHQQRQSFPLVEPSSGK
jgi:hypothetical protein